MRHWNGHPASADWGICSHILNRLLHNIGGLCFGQWAVGSQVKLPHDLIKVLVMPDERTGHMLSGLPFADAFSHFLSLIMFNI